MKNSSTSTLVTTMTVLERADWRTPAISTAAIASTRTSAGTLRRRRRPAAG
jgi:hypothetical protein